MHCFEIASTFPNFLFYVVDTVTLQHSGASWLPSNTTRNIFSFVIVGELILLMRTLQPLHASNAKFIGSDVELYIGKNSFPVAAYNSPVTWQLDTRSRLQWPLPKAPRELRRPRELFARIRLGISLHGRCESAEFVLFRFH